MYNTSNKIALGQSNQSRWDGWSKYHVWGRTGVRV